MLEVTKSQLLFRKILRHMTEKILKIWPQTVLLYGFYKIWNQFKEVGEVVRAGTLTTRAGDYADVNCTSEMCGKN
jgi:hypothetical protein